VAEREELAPGQGKMVEVNGKRIALFNIAGSFCAIDDACSHRGGPLSEGLIQGKRVVCPWHGAMFDATTGEALGPPAATAVACYPVRVEANDVQVEI
jgi:nitrite reductase/ring-hydroxylating ferredoxin subunit